MLLTNGHLNTAKYSRQSLLIVLLLKRVKLSFSELDVGRRAGEGGTEGGALDTQALTWEGSTANDNQIYALTLVMYFTNINNSIEANFS